MIGAIVGDIAGSRFEFHNRKTKEFSMLVSRGEEERCCYFTDDTVMTLAVAQAIIDWRTNGSGDMADLSAAAVSRMQEFGRRYPHAGYGGAFRRWLEASRPQPYNSWGNGSAMRVSACGWAGRTLDEVKALSRAVTEVTHDHPEGIKGAEATAVCVFLARQGKSKDEIGRMSGRIIIRWILRSMISVRAIRLMFPVRAPCRRRWRPSSSLRPSRTRSVTLCLLAAILIR